ncbi:MAG: hypothetical protein VXZ96_17175 [Myxococcota bacterium]|nr:hypothetical protein [Myxococcota bacterium]
MRACTDDELCQAYEQAGVVYMGLGRWEEAQVNFEAADAALQANVNDPNCGIDLVHRKHTLMTNIGHLMVKRGNVSWGLLFGREVVSHPRVSEYNKGWAYLVIGEAELKLNHPQGAAESFNTAVKIFGAELERINVAASLDGRMHCRQLIQAEGNHRWANVHALKAAVLL